MRYLELGAKLCKNIGGFFIISRIINTFNIEVYNIVISLLCTNLNEGFSILDIITNNNIQPNNFTYSSLKKLCKSSNDINLLNNKFNY